MGLLKETVDFCRFFWKTPKADKAIVFYSERKGHYPFFEGIISELLHKHHQPISYVTSDPNDPILNTTEEKIKSFYIQKLLPIFFSLVRCRVFVMTLTDLNQFHLKRSVHPVHYVYMFHSLVSTHMGFRAGSFDHYDSILCPGPQQQKEIRKYEKIHNLPKKWLVEGGYYRLELLYDSYKKYHKKLHKDIKGTILIAPSWGDKNILESCGKQLVKILLDANYHVIVRPHSETIKRHPELIEDMKKLYQDNIRFSLDTLGHKDDSLFKADVLITDYSGIALSYAFGTDKPVLFIDVPKKIKNQEYKELGIEPIELSLRSKIGVVLPPNHLEKIPAAVSRLIKNTKLFKVRNSQLRKKYIYAFGRSSQVGAQHIMNIYHKKNSKQDEISAKLI